MCKILKIIFILETTYKSGRFELAKIVNPYTANASIPFLAFQIT